MSGLINVSVFCFLLPFKKRYQIAGYSADELYRVTLSIQTNKDRSEISGDL